MTSPPERAGEAREPASSTAGEAREPASPIEFLSPVWPDDARPRPARKRPAGLEGATIALVDDNLDISFTTHLEALLQARYGAKVRRLVKPSGTAPSPPALIADAAEADAAVVGIGL